MAEDLPQKSAGIHQVFRTAKWKASKRISIVLSLGNTEYQKRHLLYYYGYTEDHDFNSNAYELHLLYTAKDSRLTTV